MNDPDLTVLEKLYHSGAWLCLAILIAFWGLRFASSRVAWLQTDHRAAYVAAALGGLATLVVPATQGTTPSVGMLVASLGTAWALFTQPSPSLVGVTAPADKQAGFVRIGLIVFVAIFGVIAIGCAWFQKEGKAVAGDVVTCGESQVAKAAIAEFGPLVDAQLVQATSADGKVDVARVKDGARSFLVGTGMCVLADRFAAALNPKPTDPNAPKSSPLEADPASLHAAFDSIRAELAPGKTFRTDHGAL